MPTIKPMIVNMIGNQNKYAMPQYSPPGILKILQNAERPAPNNLTTNSNKKNSLSPKK